MLTTLSTTAAQSAITSDSLQFEGAGSTVPTYSWSDSSVPAKAVIIALHGGVQHGRNYEQFAKKLVSQGFIVYAIDFRGHGSWLVKTKKRPKVDYNGTSEDVVKVAQQLRSRYPNLPLFCMGESLGASVAMTAESMQPHLFDGIILASAGDRPALKHQTGATIHSIGSGIKSLGGNVNVTAHIREISEDPRNSEFTVTDPLGRRESSVWSLLHTVNFLHAAHRLAPEITDVPVLVLSGDSDHIIDPRSTDDLYETLATSTKTIKHFPDTGHLLITSRYPKDEVVNAVTDWLLDQSRIAAAEHKRPAATHGVALHSNE